MDQRGVAKRIAILIASSILILLFFVCIPVVSAYVHNKTVLHAYRVINSNEQATQTVDATVTALNKEKLVQEIQQLKNQNDRSITTWFWNSSAALGTIVAALLAVVGVLATVTFNFMKELKDRQDARKKQAEERFKSVVEGLGGQSAETKIVSAVLLRTFLGPDYQEFYAQVFDLAVASLRSPKYTKSSKILISSVNIPEFPDSLSQAFVTVFKEAFPLAREEVKKQLREQKAQFNPQFLDATDVQLNETFLFGADLREAWMPGASLVKANLNAARLNGINLREALLLDAKLEQVILSKEDDLQANLNGANLTNARLKLADLTGANLRGAILTGAKLDKADLTGADLREWVEDGEPRPTILSYAQFEEATLTGAILDGADLTGADLSRADLTGAHLRRAILIRAKLDGANLSDADLSDANLEGTTGISAEELEIKANHLQGATMPDGSKHP